MYHEHLPAELMERTPVYAFDIPVLKKRTAYLRSALPEHVRLCYAVKANPFLVKELQDCVDCFEICSPGELTVCERVHIPREMFVLSGVYKDEPSMRCAFERGLCEGILTVESVRQFELLSALAEEYRHPVRLLLRLTSGNQFGLSEEELMDLLRKLRSDGQMPCATGSAAAVSADTDAASADIDAASADTDAASADIDAASTDTDAGSTDDNAERTGRNLLSLAGIQFFSGTQKTSLKKHRRELRMLDDLLDQIREELGMEIPEIEYGPGFPAAYFIGETFDEDAYLEEFSGLLGSMRNRIPLVLELGRSIAASCGSLLTKVVDVKCNHSEYYAILDSGIHHLAYYGQFMAMKHPFCEVWPPRESSAEDPEWNLCGALCTVNDLVVKKLPVRDLKVGDVFVFHNTGAYSMTEGISLFLSRDLPAVICIRESGEEELLRGAEPTWRLNGGTL